MTIDMLIKLDYFYSLHLYIFAKSTTLYLGQPICFDDYLNN